MSNHKLPEEVLLAAEQERWQIVIGILSEIKSSMQDMKAALAEVSRDQKEAGREHGRLENRLDEFEIRLDRLEEQVKSHSQHRDEVLITIRNAKFLLGGTGIAGLITWFKSLGGQ